MVRVLGRQFLTFLFVGGSTTAIQFAFLIVLIEFVDTGEIAASATSYLVAAAYNYLLNYHLTFKSMRSHWQTLPKFVVVVIVGISVNTSVFAVSLNILPYILAQCLAVGAALITNFLLHKYWIYRNDTSQTSI